MKALHQQTISTVTGVFATREDAERAYQTLMKLGYRAEEITLIMSEDTCDRLYEHDGDSFYNNSGMDYFKRKQLQVSRISDALDVYGKFVAIPGLALVVAGDLTDGGFRALSGSVMSDEYGEYFQSRIQDGEILIDFGLHTPRERNLIIGLWENYGGYPIVRKINNAA